jgi:alpha-glucosidase
MQSLVQSTKEKPSDTLFLQVYNGNAKNTFIYYEDDGSSMGYQKGDYCKRNIELNPGKKQLLITKQEGTFNSIFKYVQIIFHGFGPMANNIRINNTSTELQNCNFKLLDALEGLSDLYDAGTYRQLQNNQKMATCKTTTINYSSGEIYLQW